MIFYISFLSKAHSFLLERRLNQAGMACEMVYLPAAILADSCSIGLKFVKNDGASAAALVRNAGFPGARLFQEVCDQGRTSYIELRV